MFNTTNINLGVIRVGIQQIIEFPYDNISLITKIKPSCDCSEAYNLASEGKLVVKYTPKPIPVHLKEVGQYRKAVSINVTFTTTEPGNPEATQTLTFEATIKG